MEKKKTIIFFVIAVIIILGLMIFSDKTFDTEQIESNTNTVENENKIEVKSGENFLINLESNPTTGYSWVSDFDENYVELINKDFVQQKTDELIVGAGGTETFSFKALKAGEIKIDFYYVREWEIDVAPIDQKVFDVTIE